MKPKTAKKTANKPAAAVPIPGTLVMQWAVNYDPAGDGDFRTVQAKWAELSDAAKAVLRDDLARLTKLLPPPTDA